MKITSLHVILKAAKDLHDQPAIESQVEILHLVQDYSRMMGLLRKVRSQ